MDVVVVVLYSVLCSREAKRAAGSREGSGPDKMTQLNQIRERGEGQVAATTLASPTTVAGEVRMRR